jgi:glycine/D-amino acid oxidase-like deaminating enzyme
VEGTRALRIAPRAVVTAHGTVRARYVVRATEAWSAHLPSARREVAPVYAHLVATAPLPAATWDAIGLDRAQTFGDGRHQLVRGQRTADGRVVLGVRDAAYHARSAIRPAFDDPRGVAHDLEETLVDLFPVLDGVVITHRWGGPLAVPRDRMPSVGLDDDGLGWAGGYVGDGVAAANLAGRTLADLVHGSGSALTRLPWVGHRSPAWEPEPVRWAGIAAARRAAAWADRAEARTGHESRAAALLDRLTR